MSAFSKLKRCLPLWTIISFSLGLISLGVYLFFKCSVSFADFYNETVSFALRWVLAKISGAVNFSLSEMFIFMAPIIIALVVIITCRASKRGYSHICRVFVSILAIGSLLWVSFVNVFAAGYYGKSVAEKLELNTENIGADEIAMTMLYLTSQINALCAENDFLVDENGATLSPYPYRELSSKIVSAYDAMIDSVDGEVVSNFKSRVKPIILSRPLTYTHIAGIYTYFTGEANVNVNFPDYLMVSSMAHEMAHQRGIAPEDEASFVAFLALISSDDPYLRYCGYMDVYSYMSNALYQSGAESWSSYRSMLCDFASAELRAYSAFFEPYRDNAAEKVTNSVNDSYLKSQGTEGTVAYELVVELVVAYLMNR